jgi:hypothetical protein
MKIVQWETYRPVVWTFFLIASAWAWHGTTSLINQVESADKLLEVWEKRFVKK